MWMSDMTQDNGGQWWRHWAAPCTLFAATLAVRSWLWNTNLIGWDEWIQSAISSRLGLWTLPEHKLYDVLVPTGYSYPPFFLWINGALVYLFGAEPLVLRLQTIVSEAAAVAMVFVLGRRIGGRIAGWTAGLFALSSLYLNFHNSVTLDFALCFWILLSLYLLLRSLDEDKAAFLWGAIFAGSIGLFTKYHGVVYFGPLCVFAVAAPQTRAMLLTKRFPLFLGAALALPLVLLALECLTWHFYSFDKTHIAEVFKVMQWKSYVVDPISGTWDTPAWHYYFAYCATRLNPVICLLSIAGMGMALRSPRRNRATFLLAMFIILWFLWASTGSIKNARYALPGVFAAFALAGLPLEALSRTAWGRISVAFLLTVAVGLSLHDTAQRMGSYQERASNHRQVHALINAETSKDARIVADGRPFQTSGGLGIAPIQRSVVDPVNYRRGETSHIITHEDSFAFTTINGNQFEQEYVEDRAKIVRDWRLMLDVGDGPHRIRVFERP